MQTDHGDHRDVMLGGIAAQSIIYSSASNPVDLNDNADLDFAATNKASQAAISGFCYVPPQANPSGGQPPVHVPNGCVARMIDFTPGAASDMHRALTLGIGTVCEGEVELSLGSGEKRVLRPGDVSVNRGTMHKWRNTSNEKPARVLFIMLDIKPLVVNGKTLEFEMGELMDEYAKYAEGEGPNKKA